MAQRPFSIPLTRPATRLATAALVAATTLAAAPAARAQDYHVRHYTIDDGLPSSQVQDVTQDVHGRMWFATRSGVAAYDGSEWSIYNLAHGLTWTDTFALEWDAKGVLWSVGSVFPFKTYFLVEGRWNPFPEPAGLPANAWITSFAVVDEGGRRRVAVGTNQGLLLSDGAAWRRYSAADVLPADEVTALAVLDGRLVVATARGLVEARGGEFDPTVGAALPRDFHDVHGLAVESSFASGARLWIVGGGWIGHLDGRRFTLDSDELPLAPPPPRTRLLAVPDRRGGLYLGHPGAFFHFRRSTGFKALGRGNGLASDGVSALYLDREDNLWVGSRRGLAKIANRRFATYNRRHGLLDDEVTAVVERRGGVVALAHPRGLSFVTEHEIRSLDLMGERRVSVQRPDRIRDLAEDRHGNLWVPADGVGLARIDPSGRVTWFGQEAGLSGSVTSVLARSAAADGTGDVLVVTPEGLLGRRGARFERVSADAPRIHIRRIFESSQGDLLLAASSGLYHLSDAGWRRWACSEDVPCNSVFAVLEQPDGSFWAGTSAGLYRTEGDALVKHAAPAVDHPIYFIVRDDEGRTWFGIDNGALRWNGRVLEHFTVRDGLAGRETNRAAGLVDSRGRVWIGTERGVTVYDEGPPGPRRAPPSVALTELDAAGERRPLDLPQELGYDANDVVFHFRAVSLVDEERLRVSWWLENFEPDWLPPQAAASREIRYTNLPPGEYRLHVKAMNAEGTWSAVATSAPLTVARPYWQQWWFYLLAAVTVAAALYLVQSHAAQKRYSRRLELEVDQRIEQLRKIETELAKSQRLEALGLLAGGIAHDFNNFLTVLLGNLSLLSLRSRSAEQKAADLEDARAAVLRASKLTQQLLTFSRGGAPVRKAASISEVIAESASFVLSGSKVRCDVHLPDDLRVVEIDADQIHQLINNLLINAMQAMPEGGTVRIVGRNVDAAPPGLAAGRYVAIDVVDQGVGIPEEHQARIFDPYFSTKKEGKGIGLASAYSIARRHEGLLTVDSRPGRGATFTLFLPGSEADVAESHVSSGEIVVGSGKILIVDDEESVRRVTGAMVEDLGYQVEYAAHGEEAVELYRRAMAAGEPFEVVLMDLTIPGGMGGQEAIRRLSALDPEVKAIVMSGYSNDPVLANYRDYGFQGMLSKPFRSRDLARVLAEPSRHRDRRVAAHAS